MRRPIVEFGEAVLAKLTLKRRVKGKDKKLKNKLAARSILVTWVGQIARIGEHMVIKKDGNAVRCRTIRRVPEADRWNAEALGRVRVTPGTSYVPVNRGQVRFSDPAAEAGPTTDKVKAAGLRKLRVNQIDLDEFGYYATCPQCTHVQRHGRPRAGATHTNECRQRIIEHLKMIDTGRARL